MKLILKVHMSILLLCSSTLSHAQIDPQWLITKSISLNTEIVGILKDPHRPYLYALDRTNGTLLFINLDENSINQLYVGALPTSVTINEAGTTLYVANKGSNTGTSDDYQIAVVDIESQTKSHHFSVTYQPVNLAMGSNNRLYYNNGEWENSDIDSYTKSNTGIIDLSTETQLGGIGFKIKSRMITNNDNIKLYGQYVYYANLGEMGVFDIENSTVSKLDRTDYSPYPYGWDYNNYSISADGNVLAYGKALFDANNLSSERRIFSELIHALNTDGSVAFGENSIWDTTTFATEGSPALLWSHNLSSSVMIYDHQENCLYAFTTTDNSIRKIEFKRPIELNVVADGENMKLLFHTVPGVQYDIQESNNLLMWTRIVRDINGEGYTKEYFFNTSPSCKFYRVIPNDQ